jgi:hypothetical protein
MKKSLVALVTTAMTMIWSGVAMALPPGHVPVFLIPFAKSSTLSGTAESVTIVSITRVGGTTSCAVSVDWRQKSGVTVATTTSTLLGGTAATNLVGETHEHCSQINFSPAIASCDNEFIPGLNFEGKAVIGAPNTCSNSLAVDARVIYIDPDTGKPMAVHSLRVLKPYTVGNKGD